MIRRFHAPVLLSALFAALCALPAAADTVHSNETISSPTTWAAADGDHIVVGAVVVNSSLTIEDGCVIRFDSGAYMEIGGSLHATGTTSGIQFTRRDAGEQWNGVRFFTGSSATLVNCTFEFVASGIPAVNVAGASVNLVDCMLRYSGIGLRVTSGSPPDMTGCTFNQNLIGIELDGLTNPSLGDPNTFLDNTTGILIENCTNASIDHQTISGSTGTEGAIFVRQSGPFHLGANNSATGNSWGLTIDVASGPDAASMGNIPLAGNTNDDAIQVIAGTSNRDVTWHDFGADYEVNADLVIGSPGSLSIDDGVIVRFGYLRRFTIAGALDATSGGAPIEFLTAPGVPFWIGLSFSSGATGTLRNCIIRKASTGSSGSGIYAQGTATIDLEGCLLTENDYGLRIDGASVSLKNCIVTDNFQYGISLQNDATATFGGSLSEWNDIHSNGSGQLDRDLQAGVQDVTAAYVYWGSENEAVIEDRIHHEEDDPARGRVDFVPWSNADHDLEFGISFVNVTPVALLEPASANGGAWGDFDDDGDLDLYVVAIGPNKLFENVNGDFLDVTPAVLADPAQSQEARWVDFDDDGDLDLALANLGEEIKIFRNEGAATWQENVVEHQFLEYHEGGWSSAWSDVDLDGDLDPAFGREPHGGEIWLNDGNGTLVESENYFSPPDRPKGVAWGDLDGDGRPELLCAGSHEFGSAPYYEREAAFFHYEFDGAGQIVSSWMHRSTDPLHYSSVTLADADGDGDLDVFVGAYGGPDLLFCNDGGQLVDCTPLVLQDDGLAVSGAWGDYDNDGLVDLMVTNEESANRLYRNLGSIQFQDVTNELLADAGVGDSGGAAWADYDDDGDLDLFVAAASGANRLFRNDSNNTHHWLQIDLTGVTSNRRGFGARIEVDAGGDTQVHEVSTGSGFRGGNWITAHFGLGTATLVDAVRVRWPTGQVEDYGSFAVDQRVTLIEGQSVTSVELPADTRFLLRPNVPNPFAASTEFSFELTAPARVRLRVFDASGRVVRTLRDAEFAVGRHAVRWDGRDVRGRSVASGIYFASLDAGGRVVSRRLVRLR